MTAWRTYKWRLMSARVGKRTSQALLATAMAMICLQLLRPQQSMGSVASPVGELAARADAYYRNGDCENAITVLNQLIKLQPTLVSAYIVRGSAYQQKGDASNALTDFNQAIRLDPRSARAYCDRGILEDVLLQQPKQALADYNKAIRLAPDFKRAYINRGVHLLGQKDYERAIPDFTRAIQLTHNERGNQEKERARKTPDAF